MSGSAKKRPGGNGRVTQSASAAASRSSGQPSPSSPPAKSGSPVWILAVVAVVVLAVGAIAIAVRGGGDDSTTVAAGSDTTVNGAAAGGAAAGAATGSGPLTVAPVTIAGEALPAMPEKAGTKDPAAGLAFPEVSGRNVLDGTPIAIRADGRPKIVIYVAHWCPHCQKEVPVIQEWLDANGAPQAVDLYAVSTAVDESRGNYPPAAWLTKEKWSVPTLADSAQSSAFVAAGLTSFPSFVVVDAEGNVVTRTSGELSTTAFETLLDAAASRS